MSDLLQGLNPAQRRAVEAISGPVLVLAGPGSGKTRVLTHRIAHLIQTAGVDPLNLLAVTFTNRAAREMRERLTTLVGKGVAMALTVGTFHSLCARFLRRDIVYLERARDFVIYDSDDQERLVRRMLHDLNLDVKQYQPRSILSRISSAKNELVSPTEFSRINRGYRDEVVARCYQRYQVLLREANALDFDDLLVETVRLFEQHPTVLAHYQQRYHYMLVDEYQDTNRVQYVLVQQLAAQRRNLFVVGDEDQSVYGFRGADVRNIRSFEQDYPEAQVILLEQNYRSTQAILDTAQAVISADAGRKHGKKLWTENSAGLHVALYKGYDQEAEAAFVADEIVQLVASGTFTMRDCAVLYRTNAQSRALEEAFSRRGLRYQIIGGIRFWERKEVKDVLAYLRFAANPFDSVSLTRILNWPTRGIGERTEIELARWAAQLGVPLFQALKELDNEHAASPFSARTINILRSFLCLTEELNAACRQLPLVQFIAHLLERVPVRETLVREYKTNEADERWRNVEELSNVANRYSALPLEEQLPTFLEEVALVADVDKLDQMADAVTCITLHQAKGLEYPAVFLVGLEDGLVPHSRSLDQRDQLEEERRLLYVGMTRAKQRLYLCHAGRRMSFGHTATTIRSRFLEDIPPALIKSPMRQRAVAAVPQLGIAGRNSGTATNREVARASVVAMPPTKPSAANTVPARLPQKPRVVTFFAGQRVAHTRFGEGVVVSSRLIDGDEEVTVSFTDRERRLLAELAGLVRVEA